MRKLPHAPVSTSERVKADNLSNQCCLLSELILWPNRLIYGETSKTFLLRYFPSDSFPLRWRSVAVYNSWDLFHSRAPIYKRQVFARAHIGAQEWPTVNDFEASGLFRYNIKAFEAWPNVIPDQRSLGADNFTFLEAVTVRLTQTTFGQNNQLNEVSAYFRIGFCVTDPRKMYVSTQRKDKQVIYYITSPKFRHLVSLIVWVISMTTTTQKELLTELGLCFYGHSIAKDPEKRALVSY